MIKLKDVMFLCHPKARSIQQEKDFKDLASDNLKSPDTWETEISKNKSNKESWERLLNEKKLGSLALIRNLRNMLTQKVTPDLIRKSLSEMKTERVLPFRFIAAARYAPDYEPELEQAMYRCLDGKGKLSGRTILLVDISGSMDDKLSGKSEMLRTDAAFGLAILAREMCEDVQIFSFSNEVVKIPPRRGFALRDAIAGSQDHSGTYLGKAIEEINRICVYDRIIVITDEQSHDTVPKSRGKGYVINVASYENGIGYGDYTHINGWSEAVLDYIKMYEDGPDMPREKVIPVQVEPKNTTEVLTARSSNAKSGTKKTHRGTGKRVPRNGTVRKGA